MNVNLNPRLAAIAEKLKNAGQFLLAQLKRFGRFMQRLNRPLLKHPDRLIELLILPVTFIYYEIVFRLFGGSSLFSGLGYAILFAIGYASVINFITSFLKQRAYKIVMKIAMIASGVLYTFEAIILTSFQVYMTFATIFTAAGDVVGDFMDTLIAAIVGGIPRIILFMLPSVLYILKNRGRDIKRPLHPRLRLEMLIFALVFCLTGTFCSTTFAHEKYASQYEFDNATRTFGLLTGVRLDIKYALFGNKAADSFTTVSADGTDTDSDDAGSTDADSADGTGDSTDDTAETTTTRTEDSITQYDTENIMDLNFTGSSDDVTSLDEYVASLDATSQNEYTGLFEGKNLILICAEAFSGTVISEELTPTLYRLQHNGIYFSDYYQPAWGGSTSTGEYSFLMGLVPTNGASSIKDTIGNNNYFTMGNQMQRLGYFTLAFHAGSYTYYDRDQTHYNLGFDTWLASGNGLEDLIENTSDEATIDAMFDYFANEDQFCVYWMTLSGHASYTAERTSAVSDNLDRVTEVVGDEGYSDRVLYYLCFQLKLEDALTLLIERLEEEGLADDTVICLTTDHYPYGLSESTTYDNPKDYMEELYGDTYDFDIPWERDKNALILWCGSLENEDADMAIEISSPTYSLDILPTLSNLFGLEYDSRLLVGRDVFSDADALVIWNNYSWKTTHGSYNASTKEYTPNEGYTEDEDYISTIKDIVKNKITFSKLAVSTDYYGELFGEDTVGNDGSEGNLITFYPSDDEEEDSTDTDSDSDSDDDADTETDADTDADTGTDTDDDADADTDTAEDTAEDDADTDAEDTAEDTAKADADANG